MCHGRRNDQENVRCVRVCQQCARDGERGEAAEVKMEGERVKRERERAEAFQACLPLAPHGALVSACRSDATVILFEAVADFHVEAVNRNASSVVYASCFLPTFFLFFSFLCFSFFLSKIIFTEIIPSRSFPDFLTSLRVTRIFREG